MSDSKKKRMSMLDTLAAAGAPAPQPIMSNSRPLRAARDAVDSHKVWDIEPDDIIDTRIADRLDLADVHDLQLSIETTGQTVPILLRRHPNETGKYLLVYGRRRLEAIKNSDQITTVRALVAQLDDDKAVEAQISENTARRDLSYIEKALFAHELIEGGFGNQSRVAEVLTATKSAISMALGIVADIGPDLIRAIGPAHGVGRPRWETLAQLMAGQSAALRDDLIGQAAAVRGRMEIDVVDTTSDPSVVAFDSVFDRMSPQQSKTPKVAAKKTLTKRFHLKGGPSGAVQKTAKGVRFDVDKGAFADWLADQAEDLMQDLHARFETRRED